MQAAVLFTAVLPANKPRGGEKKCKLGDAAERPTRNVR